MNIKSGDTIKSDRWPEPVKIDLLKKMGVYVQLVGSTIHSRTHIDQLLHQDEVDALESLKLAPNFTAKARHVFLSLEALRYRYAARYDSLFAVNASKVDPLPHQVDAVYGHVLKLPRIRFLIADDPGAGKTIMAGLIIKELKLRHLINRVLIVVPGHLKDQWRRELKDRFEESFLIMDRALLSAQPGENVWAREPSLITSIDFAKRDDVKALIESSQWDLIIVDEAHKMAAYQYGNKLKKTGRYQLGETLSRISTHLLFLTATPHKGDPENFRLFLDLLEPGFFATSQMLSESITARDNPLFLRRVKEDMKDFEGKPLFLPRHVDTLSFDLGVDSPKEKELYNDLSDYVNSQYNKALTKNKRNNVAFALVILQRRLASSTYALRTSLDRRKARLQELLDGVVEKKAPVSTIDFETIDDLSEEERWKEEEIWEMLSVAENRAELEREIETLETLANMSQEIIESETEIKVRELRNTLIKLNTDFSGEKILIFTESRDTLSYLQDKMEAWGYAVTVIHGGMKLEDRIEAEKEFKNRTRVLIATEAAGEGINLQFCHLMINYDLPWNPNRLEQRMGRIHRYGQTKECFVVNLVAEDTREGMVLTALFKKIKEIQNALGSDKVFDVLSEVLYGVNLSQLLLEAAASAKGIDEILAEIDIEVDEEYITQVKENLGESLATHYIDYTRIREMAERAREQRLIPEYTEAFFRKAFAELKGRLHDRRDKFLTIESIPFQLRRLAGADTFKRKHGSMLRNYPKATFDKERAFKNPDAEFISFGHPLFEAILVWVENELSNSLKQGAVFEDPDGRMDGVILFYEGEIRDGLGQIVGVRLFAFYIRPDTGMVELIDPKAIWDLAESSQQVESEDLETLKGHAMTTLMPVLEDYKVELAVERKRQTEIKEKYGLTSLEHLRLQLDGDLIQLYARRDAGDNVDLVIRNKEEQKQGYEDALIKLKETIAQERVLTMSTPNFVGAIRVIPRSITDTAMKNDPEIEQIGMETTMLYEREHGRIPEDVAAENLGFDVRSTDSAGAKRYIEVKARAGLGAVTLTQNEWFKAQQFQSDYFLYVVLNAATQPELYIIQNPDEQTQPEEKIEAVRYQISLNEIRGKGVKSSGESNLP
jgi:superfamily II DNA or RNA helicase